jgi:hypothetical protein
MVNTSDKIDQNIHKNPEVQQYPPDLSIRHSKFLVGRYTIYLLL